MNLDLWRPGAPAGDESRKLCGGEDMTPKDAAGVVRSFFSWLLSLLDDGGASGEEEKKEVVGASSRYVDVRNRVC